MRASLIGEGVGFCYLKRGDDIIMQKCCCKNLPLEKGVMHFFNESFTKGHSMIAELQAKCEVEAFPCSYNIQHILVYISTCLRIATVFPLFRLYPYGRPEGSRGW